MIVVHATHGSVGSPDGSTATPAGALVDLDGTVYRGGEPIPGAADGVGTLRDAGTDVLFVTNKAIDSPETCCENLANFGIDCDRDDVVTSASVTASFLRRRHPNRRAYVVGEEPLTTVLADANVPVTSDPTAAEVVVASLDRTLDYDTLAAVLVALDSETPYVATNPDRTCPVADGEIPGAGVTIGAIEGCTGRPPDAVLGKPSETMTTVATRRLDADPGECIVVGDRLETDIAMGNRAGMDTVLVLSGVTDRSDLVASPIEPDHVVDTVDDLDDVLW